MDGNEGGDIGDAGPGGGRGKRATAAHLPDGLEVELIRIDDARERLGPRAHACIDHTVLVLDEEHLCLDPLSFLLPRHPCVRRQCDEAGVRAASGPPRYISRYHTVLPHLSPQPAHCAHAPTPTARACAHAPTWQLPVHHDCVELAHPHTLGHASGAAPRHSTLVQEWRHQSQRLAWQDGL